MPQRDRAGSHLTDGPDLRVARYPEVRAMRDRDVAHTEDDMEVREAMSHCPQCGSGHFTAYPTEGPAPER
jgi:hypothetical protein